MRLAKGHMVMAGLGQMFELAKKYKLKIAFGAHADILLIDGNPLKDISILQNYEEILDMIMKGGVIYKDAL